MLSTESAHAATKQMLPSDKAHANAPWKTPAVQRKIKDREPLATAVIPLLSMPVVKGQLVKQVDRWPDKQISKARGPGLQCCVVRLLSYPITEHAPSSALSTPALQEHTQREFWTAAIDKPQQQRHIRGKICMPSTISDANQAL